MDWNETPDRRIGLLTGLIGGAIGTAIMHYYIQAIEPHILPELLNVPESLPETAGQMLYSPRSGNLSGMMASPDLFAGETGWASGIIAGGIYGATRTTTAPRDLAGGFFYGIRLWLGETALLSLVGLHPNPIAAPIGDQVRRLLRVWIFSFTSTAITRLLYIILAEQR